MTDISAPPAPPSAPPLVHLDALPVGARLAEFEVQSLLGVGGFGMVYRAYDHSLHRTVAIKEYMPSALASRRGGLSLSVRSPADQQTYQLGLKSFVAEARLLAQFDHPSLVKVYRFWEENNTAYMVMPLYSGMTLKQARSQMDAPPPEHWLRTVIWSILQGLSVLHEHKTLHRDVSPDNIFLQDLGPPVLLDLGAARRSLADGMAKHTALVKVNYAPVEQFGEAEGLREGPWTDIYSLAGVIYGCLRNEPPLPSTLRALRDRMLPISEVVKTVKSHYKQTYSKKFVGAIHHALRILPDRRTQSVQALIEDMQLVTPVDLARFDWRAELKQLFAPSSGKKDVVRAAAQPMRVRDTTEKMRWSLAHLLTLRQYFAKESEYMQTRALDFDEIQASGGHAVGKPVRRSRFAGSWMLVAGLVLTGAAVYWGPGTIGSTSPQPVAPEPVREAAVTSEKTVVKDAIPLATVAQRSAAAGLAAAPDPRPSVGTAAPESEKAGSAGAVEAPPRKPQGKKPAEGVYRDTAATRPLEPKTAAVKPTAAKAAAPNSRELCADANFFSRPICIHEACKKAQNASLPACIDDRERYPPASDARP